MKEVSEGDVEQAVQAKEAVIAVVKTMRLNFSPLAIMSAMVWEASKLATEDGITRERFVEGASSAYEINSLPKNDIVGRIGVAFRRKREGSS